MSSRYSGPHTVVSKSWCSITRFGLSANWRSSSYSVRVSDTTSASSLTIRRAKSISRSPQWKVVLTISSGRLARRSTTRLGWLTTYTGGLTIVLGSLFGWGAILIAPAFRGTGRGTAGEDWLRIVAPFVLAVVDLVVLRFAVDRWGRVTYPRVLGWARGLPFPIENLEAMLGASPPTVGVVTLRFEGAAELERVAAAVTGLDRRWVTAQVHGDTVVVSHGCLGVRDGAGPQAADTNYSYLAFVRWLVDRLLLTLHASTPIASVAVAAA